MSTFGKWIWDPTGFEQIGIMYMSHVYTGMSLESKHMCLRIFIYTYVSHMFHRYRDVFFT